jgi:hypothetical protein
MESAKKVSVFRVNGVQTDHAIITVELFFLADVEPNIRIIDRSVFGTPLSRIKWSPLSLREGLGFFGYGAGFRNVECCLVSFLRSSDHTLPEPHSCSSVF